MSNILALVLAGGHVEELLCLTEKRAKSALPVFGIYRIIDFVLSNLMHAGIENVGILSQYRPHDLVRHIGNGEHWDFLGRQREIRILPPYRGLKGSDWYKGTADAVYQNIPFIEEFDVDHILILSADHVYRMDYKALIDMHLRNDADATICFTEQETKSTRFGYGRIENERLVAYVEKPPTPFSDLVSMTLYLFKKDFLINMLHMNARESSHEFGKDIIPHIVRDHNVFAFTFPGYWAYARTIRSYFRTNMALLQNHIPLSTWQIRTNLTERSKYKDRIPAYVNGDVANSVVSDECRIEGTVKNSILSPGVRVSKGSSIENSIIFHDTVINENVQLRNVICDKDVVIEEDVAIGLFGQEIPSKDHASVLGDGISVIGRTMKIPHRTTIGAHTVIYPGARIETNRIEPGRTLR